MHDRFSILWLCLVFLEIGAGEGSRTPDHAFGVACVQPCPASGGIGKLPLKKTFSTLLFNLLFQKHSSRSVFNLNPAVESGAQTQFFAPQQLATQFDGPQRVRLHYVASPSKTNSCISASTSTAGFRIIRRDEPCHLFVH